MMITLAAVGFKNGDIAYNKEKIKTVIRDHGNKQVDTLCNDVNVMLKF